MKRVTFTRNANLDIEEIRGYISNLNPVAAYRFLEAVDKTCGLLAEHSLLGRERPNLGEGVRSFAVGKYLIFYTVVVDGINVIRIVYGGRDLPQVFRSPEAD